MELIRFSLFVLLPRVIFARILIILLVSAKTLFQGLTLIRLITFAIIFLIIILPTFGVQGFSSDSAIQEDICNSNSCENQKGICAEGYFCYLAETSLLTETKCFPSKVISYIDQKITELRYPIGIGSEGTERYKNSFMNEQLSKGCLINQFKPLLIDGKFSCGPLDSTLTLKEDINCDNSGFIVQSPNIELNCDGHTIYYTSSENGVFYNPSYKNVNVRKCNFVQSDESLDSTAIYFGPGSQGLIENNQFETKGSSSHSIKLWLSSANIINNQFTIDSTDDSYAIYLESSTNSEITKNTINLAKGNTNGGVYVINSKNTKIESNTISPLKTTTPLEQHNSGIFIKSSENINLTSNSVFDIGKFSYLIRIESGKNTRIEKNILGFNGEFYSTGILVDQSEQTTLTQNEITGLGYLKYAVSIKASKDTSISQNSVAINGARNGAVYTDSPAHIENNKLYLEGDKCSGVSSSLTEGLSITGNTITLKTTNSKAVKLTSIKSEVTGNTIKATGKLNTGLFFYPGLDKTYATSAIETNLPSAVTGNSIDLTGDSNLGVAIYHSDAPDEDATTKLACETNPSICQEGSFCYASDPAFPEKDPQYILNELTDMKSSLKSIFGIDIEDSQFKAQIESGCLISDLKSIFEDTLHIQSTEDEASVDKCPTCGGEDYDPNLCDLDECLELGKCVFSGSTSLLGECKACGDDFKECSDYSGNYIGQCEKAPCAKGVCSIDSKRSDLCVLDCAKVKKIGCEGYGWYKEKCEDDYSSCKLFGEAPIAKCFWSNSKGCQDCSSINSCNDYGMDKVLCEEDACQKMVFISKYGSGFVEYICVYSGQRGCETCNKDVTSCEDYDDEEVCKGDSCKLNKPCSKCAWIGASCKDICKEYPTCEDIGDDKEICRDYSCSAKFCEWKDGKCASLEDRFKLDHFMGPARDQGRCGSCWVFATVGTLEGSYNYQYFLKHGEVTSNSPTFSQQYLISCPVIIEGRHNMGCEGGREDDALEQAKIDGLALNGDFTYVDDQTLGEKKGCSRSCLFTQSLSYLEGTKICTSAECKSVPKSHKISGYGAVDNSIDAIKRALKAHGPLIVTMTTAGFNFEDKICKSSDCGTIHKMVLIGWDDTVDTPNGKGVWIFRNSWDENTYNSEVAIRYADNSCSMSDLTYIDWGDNFED